MNLLIIGSGAREHAFAWKSYLSKYDTNIYVTNANPGFAGIAKNVIINVDDFESIKDCILTHNISFVLVGPEIPLINGIADYIKNESSLSKVVVIGPSKRGSMLEGSKYFAKKFMKKYNIPTANYKSFNKYTINQGIEYIKNSNPPYVIKADGPAAGKGVVIIDDKNEAVNILKEMLLNLKFGKSSQKVVIEEFLKGIEMSCFVLFDGLNYKILPYAKDYKRIGEGDTGLNTGGMGSISPVNFLDNDLKNKIENEIIKPTVNGLIKEKIDYIGFIFIGLINVNGEPKVIEYNVRMGDPETQVVLPRIKNDFIDILISCAKQNLNKVDLDLDSNYYANVVLASDGYPEEYKKGFEITGLNDIQDSLIFHAGTTINNDKLKTNGGRVLSIVSSSESMKDALNKSYLNIEKINFKGKVFRKDIGFDL